MTTSPTKLDKVDLLRSEILRMQGFKPCARDNSDLGLGVICQAFPNGSFPIGAVHEFMSGRPEESAVTAGFVSGLLTSIIGDNGACLWISASRTIFPPGLISFGVHPDRVIFLDLKKEKDVIWAMDEALKCGALSAVIGELKELSFMESRRLQLAVEQSQVTGFIVRRNVQKTNTTACVSRWRISPVSSESIDDLPGIGFPKWKVELLRMRNGRSGTWTLTWVNGRFVHFNANEGTQPSLERNPLFQQEHKNVG